MLSRLREHLGTAGLIVAVVALVAALAGGAIAATGGGKATTSAKGKPGPRGKTGKTGPAGPQGPAGAAGAKGDAGAAGANGSNGSNGANGSTILSGAATPTTQGVDGDFYIKTGASPQIFGPKTGGAWGSGTNLKGTNGTNGTNGSSILNGTGAPSAQGEDGDFYIDTAANVIYGPKAAGAWPVSGTSLVGPQGAPGPEGNIKQTLPPGIAMKGTWSSGPYNATAASEPVFGAISLNIPLELSPNSTIYLRKTESESSPTEVGSPGVPYRNCEGGSANPTVGSPVSGSRVLCIFATEESNWKLERNETTLAPLAASVVSPVGAANRKFGMVLRGLAEASGASYAYGTWVVKAIP